MFMYWTGNVCVCVCVCNWNYWNVQDWTGLEVYVCEYAKVPYKTGQIDAGWLEGTGREFTRKEKREA